MDVFLHKIGVDVKNRITSIKFIALNSALVVICDNYRGIKNRQVFVDVFSHPHTILHYLLTCVSGGSVLANVGTSEAL